MKHLIINGLVIIGLIGLIVGYPLLAYVSGVATIWDHISEVASGAQTSTLTFWIALLVGIGIASNSPFSWWQGILIGFTIEGFIMLVLSIATVLISNRRF
ncbi:hypothetical protein J3A84_05440 [Proteiniclasticum sp. SCR006]|uniref:Uncharacterized protein n=1 Tax=Proteiniclasticum aestuarii TaxID=2817862 RepID=A0A939H5A3_9CLOT|nr:hypothetical protein [Proteiniclasticum aestuarii]MBO1264482.1 hypothetical protein [Proteiniclasticum aestuarii]